jgi:hemoglobin-like flavoprotein
MTPQQIELVQSTWKSVAVISDQAAALFYSRLFELDPSLRRLFKSDMTEQGRKLMQMLAVAVSGLDRLESIRPALEELSRRHVGYDVRPEDYATVGAALLWTLKQGLGDAYTPAAADAWSATYAALSDVMLAAPQKRAS